MRPRARPSPLAGPSRLDVPWRELDYCVIDIETTGLNLRRDDMVSFGVVHVRNGRIRCDAISYSLVRPRRKISTASVRIHGIRLIDLREAPSLMDVTQDLRAQLTGCVLVAHAAWIETAFLGRALCGTTGGLDVPVVDTAALMRSTGLAPSGAGFEPDIEVFAGRLGLTAHEPHHALGDAMTTAEVFLALTGAIEADAEATGSPPLTGRDLIAISKRHSLT